MTGRDLKAAAVRAGLPLYQVAAEARINPSQLSRLLNDRVPVDAEAAARIQAAIDRLSEPVAARG
jgi:transcriptional regulator with XRE-family HTH domain